MGFLCHHVVNRTLQLAAAYRAGSDGGKEAARGGHIEAADNVPAAPSRSTDRRVPYFGISTVSMTWTTPFDCMTSAWVTVAPLPISSMTTSLSPCI